jgi:rSAM-associated Gly-rich repeat protein
MSPMNRREVLRSLLTGALQTAGTVVLACSALPVVAAQENQGPPAEGDLRERADRLASEEGAAPEADGSSFVAFRRGGFANGGGGGFRRGGFGNGGYGGGFRRGGFGNGGYGGGFRRGGFRNW